MKQDFNINSILQLPFIHQSHVLILKLSLHRAVVTKRQKERTTVSVPLGGGDRKAGGTGVSIARTETTHYEKHASRKCR